MFNSWTFNLPRTFNSLTFPDGQNCGGAEAMSALEHQQPSDEDIANYLDRFQRVLEVAKWQMNEIEDSKKEDCERVDFLAELPSAIIGTSSLPDGKAKFSFQLWNMNSDLLEASRLAEDAFRGALLRTLSSILELPLSHLELTLSIGSAAVQVDVCMNGTEAAGEDWLCKWRASISSREVEKALSNDMAEICMAVLSLSGDEHGHFLLAECEGWKTDECGSEVSKAIVQLVKNEDGSVSVKGHFRMFLESDGAACRDPDMAAPLTLSEGGCLKMGDYLWIPTYEAMTTGALRISSTIVQASPRPAARHSCKQRLSAFGSMVQHAKGVSEASQGLSMLPPAVAPSSEKPKTESESCGHNPPGKKLQIGGKGVPPSLIVGGLRVPLMRNSGPLKVSSTPGQPLHVVFVADVSGSMGAKDVACRAKFDAPLSHSLKRMLADFVGEERISRLQAVRSVISEFIKMQQEGDVAQSDVYSLVEFSIVHKVCFSSKTAREAKAALEELPVDLGCSTEYTKGFRGVLDVINTTSSISRVRVVFLSDGDPCDTDRMLQLFQAEFGPCGKCPYDLQFHTIGFGSGEFACLEQLAALGRGSFQLADYDLDELCKTFTSVSTSITQTRSEMLHAAKSRLSNVYFERPRFFFFRGDGFTSLTCQSRVCSFDGSTFAWSDTGYGGVQLRNHPWTQGGMHVVTAACFSGVKSTMNMVAKVPRSFYQDGVMCDSEDSSECYARNVAATTWFAEQFVSRLDNTKLCVADCQLLDIKTHSKSWPECFIVESYLRGVFVKFNNNSGYVQRTHAASDVAQAFSHFSYHESGGRMLVVDVQGIYSGESLTLSDPQVLSCDGSFGRGDLGCEGMKRFFASHRCNGFCKKLGLPAGNEVCSVVAEAQEIESLHADSVAKYLEGHDDADEQQEEEPEGDAEEHEKISPEAAQANVAQAAECSMASQPCSSKIGKLALRYEAGKLTLAYRQEVTLEFPECVGLVASELEVPEKECEDWWQMQIKSRRRRQRYRRRGTGTQWRKVSAQWRKRKPRAS
mmetsp:Transcript_146827/g.267643  ORF Transcript_146827/g.267643 Transcript_146827/m.267643 type:complete len:1031 (-) Transcript_146827:41-3133(-)